MTVTPKLSASSYRAAAANTENRSMTDIPLEGSSVVLAPSGNGDGMWGVEVAPGFVYTGP